MQKCLGIRLLVVRKILGKKCKFSHEICVPVNNVFPPDVREPLLESSTKQQCSPNTACPVLQALVDGVPTQVLWETGSGVSGSSKGFYA